MWFWRVEYNADLFRMAEASAKRVTGDTPQGTMGRVQSPSRLPLRAHRERRLGTRQDLAR